MSDSVKKATFLTLETLKWEYSFVNDMFTKLGSLLSVMSHHCSVQGAPDVSGHDHFREIFNLGT